MSPVQAPEVFSINLVRRQAALLPMRKIGLYVVIGYLALQLLWAVTLAATGLHDFGKHLGLKHQLEGRETDAAAASLLESEVDMIHINVLSHIAQYHQILALEKSRFPMAGKWAALAETLPARTWIKQLAGNRERRLLQIRAVYFVDPEKPFEPPVKIWMEALKGDPRFGTNLKRLDLETSERSELSSNVSLYTFDLTAEWKSL